MVWSAETSQGYEVKKCRRRVVTYCRGCGLDMGCGDEKIVPTAIGVDVGGKANIQVDMSEPNSLRMFADNHFDYVFSSHCLEDFYVPEVMLAEWWRLIRPGGYLILYGPDPDYYPRVGTSGANPGHKHDLYWQDVWSIIKKFGNAKKISASRHNESNEYSWQLIVKKRYGFLKRPIDLLFKRNGDGKLTFPRKKVTNKECLTIRYGAIGDAIWLTPVFRLLKEQGYYIVHNCTDYSAQVLRENPYIDEFLIQDSDAIPNEDLSEYWKEIGQSFEKVINISGSVEGKLLKIEGSEEFNWPAARRRKECGQIDYIDATMEAAGFGNIKGAKPELYFTDSEEANARFFRENFKDYFLILCSLSGSALHKTYPWMPHVAGEILKNHQDVMIITVGGMECQIIESWHHPRTINKSGVWNIRQSMIMTKYADLVIGPETGILNASACYETPKIMFLSHSGRNNLGKNWPNCVTLNARDCDCQPCHRLIYTDCCPKGPRNLAPKCMENINPHTVYAAFLKIYKNWKKNNQKEKKNVIKTG